ncbi:hypothetical protein [Konateibacter massiliensis]|uniref:hypothetical protein n=1 Tax=Konateibacter massiliensis TaxID=2002841 RepID=UPI001F36C5C0|nr:hypothetical protein [Konateibacter massiliensis]
MAMTEAQREADRRYREKYKPIVVSAAYKKEDLEEGKRVKAYLDQTGQSVNSYIKALIKADLDSKGFII